MTYFTKTPLWRATRKAMRSGFVKLKSLDSPRRMIYVRRVWNGPQYQPTYAIISEDGSTRFTEKEPE